MKSKREFFFYLKIKHPVILFIKFSTIQKNNSTTITYLLISFRLTRIVLISSKFNILTISALVALVVIFEKHSSYHEKKSNQERI